MGRYVLLGVLLFAFIQPAFAMRCGRRVVVDGYRKAKVVALCGKPDFVEYDTVYTNSRFNSTGRVLRIDRLEAQRVEIWTYNFGPHKLIHYVQFIDGIITDIEVGGYGY